MACFHPLQGLKLGLKANGKEQIKIFKTRFKNHSVLHKDVDVLLPCGQCVGCRLERSRQWAMRCVHEASLYDHNCFITLTFNDDSLRERDFPMSLDKKDFQLFMKRLRKRFGNGIRYYHCGEYGEVFSRPHYHACLFNFCFPDLYYWKKSNGIDLYRSSILEELWPYGHSSVGSVTFESAAYVARYIMKKVLGKNALLHYEDIHFGTGEIYQRVPEYTTMSRGSKVLGTGGIGYGWFERYSDDVYPNDYVVMRDRKMRPPRFYDSKLSVDILKEIKNNRMSKALEFADDQTLERLIAREKCATSKLRLFSRSVE